MTQKRGNTLKNNQKARPFLKWAGGKTQLLNDVVSFLPHGFREKELTYVEPFVGGGAVLFTILATFPNVKKAVINDINDDLINVYRTIAENINELVGNLKEIENEYLSLSENMRMEYFYQKRLWFNEKASGNVMQAALFIFLNRTCFNGLYRVNRSNKFNVPAGRYKNPLICDELNLRLVSEALQNVEIFCGDFEETIRYADNESFFYFDPPYKPLSSSSNFNAYAKDGFNDDEQIRLFHFCKKLDRNNTQWMLSNSEAENNYFDDMYSEFNIRRVKATRRINSNAQKRGVLNELIITNY